MVEPEARIRPFKAKDEKEVRFLIGKTAMEGLASANIKTILNPVSVSVWILLASLFIQYMQWWPNANSGVMGYLSLILPFGSAAVPIILFSDWNNRQYFDQFSDRVLREPDMLEFGNYYSKSPASGLWILEFDNRIVGLIAVDASVNSAAKNKKRKTSDTAVIRHVYVDEPYRAIGIQKDLIDFALQKVFTADTVVQSIKTTSSPLRAYVEKALTEAGFRFEGVAEKAGLLKWKVSKRVLTRDGWMKLFHRPVFSPYSPPSPRSEQCKKIPVLFSTPSAKPSTHKPRNTRFPGLHSRLQQVMGRYPFKNLEYRTARLRVSAPASLPIEVAMDSVDTLFEDSGSTLETIQFLKALVTAISSRPKPSRLILHICSPSKILPLIVSTSFSPSITHLIAHPPVLITHLAEEYMTPPPPLSPDVKFWGLFIPISERNRDTESLIFGPGGDGSGGHSEMVVEAIVRGGQDVSGRRKAAERFLEGWDLDQSRPVPLSQLRTLASIWKRKVVTEEAAPHSAQDILFNLHLTPSQQESRAQVPLPYAHQGHIFTQPAAGAILYDPDSADDIDDDDPDEDLDI
ncbi:hypothetical protein D9757_002880 [Collybiopsis confluens]|uniref:Elongator complex protein 5 n=1 Tax=Collybiopsis confluens TaxID=2823264 RepID=A0A8H5HVB5_9AGAR|nr:hypothetical protein D9757_002880 [Collybiopsis confluens]